MPEPDLDTILLGAAAAVSYAQDVRAHHRKRTKRGASQREADLWIARNRLREAMEPVRSVIGRAQFDLMSATKAKQIEKARQASRDLQRERRKLWKMQVGGDN
jgi:hypothetical protein